MMLAPDSLARGGDAYAASLSRFVRLAGESDSPRALVQAASSSLRLRSICASCRSPSFLDLSAR